MRSFAGDNNSGVHKKIMEELVKANVDHAGAYGDDDLTRAVKEKIKDELGACEAYFVYNGTGANVLALECIKGRAGSVICTDTAHIFADETGAVQKVTGVQLLTVPNVDGKLDIEKAKKYLGNKDTFHRATPRGISISQITESGSVYSIEELKKISAFARENGMYFHMDGARLGNSCVSLGKTLKEMTKDVGVDVLSFGGTKNGVMFGEVLVFFKKELAEDFLKIRKQLLQLNSKMRFIAAQYNGYLKDNLWYENASNANNIASYLKEKLESCGVEVVNKVEANVVFARLEDRVASELKKFMPFYTWDDGIVRFVTSFDSTREDVDGFIEKLEEVK